MPRYPDNEPLSDAEMPDEADLGGDDDSLDMAACDACGASVPEGIARCPNCGEWDPAGEQSSSGANRNRAIWTVAVFVLLAVILTTWIGLR